MVKDSLGTPRFCVSGNRSACIGASKEARIRCAGLRRTMDGICWVKSKRDHPNRRDVFECDDDKEYCGTNANLRFVFASSMALDVFNLAGLRPLLLTSGAPLKGRFNAGIAFASERGRGPASTTRPYITGCNQVFVFDF